MNKSTFATKVKEIYEKTRVPLAYILVAAAIVLRFLPWSGFAVPALIALGLILLPILFEIHKAVTAKESARCFASYPEAIPSIKQALDTYIHRKPNPSIHVLGIALYYQWPMLDDYLSNTLLAPNPPCLNLQITLLDPAWEESPRLDKPNPEQAQSSLASIHSFVAQNKERIQKCGWTIEVWTFRYTPHWYGILVGEKLLFVGTSFWDHGRLRGGSNPVEMFATGDALLGSQKIEEFRGWFQQCQQQKVDIGLNV